MTLVLAKGLSARRFVVGRRTSEGVNRERSNKIRYIVSEKNWTKIWRTGQASQKRMRRHPSIGAGKSVPSKSAGQPDKALFIASERLASSAEVGFGFIPVALKAVEIVVFDLDRRPRLPRSDYPARGGGGMEAPRKSEAFQSPGTHF